ncbi:hypothetical protein [Xenorhabdus sp. BG5]|uniref:hypothetical protein n=1 Tax=Xenorhabdus sp. BG5 TaxID=2782014 RepID=UPI00187EC1EF|nr:hypothetical protein [Xenorhabdus sp. BG5]MBE8596769.1 hypothetical protein [Xenorhabdus sp. BG5]
MEKFLAATSTFIEKATDIRYFLLFASFLIVTDTVLCKTINTPLLQFTYSDVTNKLHLGAVLVYMSFFLFYTSVLIPFIAYVIGLILIYLPSWVTNIFPDINEDKRKNPNRYSDQISIDILRNEAVAENNSVKFNLYIKRENENNDEYQLYKLSFTFLFTLILSFFINFNNQSSILNTLFNYAFNLGDFMSGIILIITTIFIIYCIGLGIGGYCLKRYTDSYIYIGNKNIKP